jgi:hypothetical protein
VVCECLYTPFGKPGSGNEIEFIATKYDKTQLGSQATFILFTVTEGPDFTKTAPNSSKIIDEIQKASTDTIKFSKLPAMKNAEIDLTAYVGSMKELIKEYDDVNSVLTARKQADLVTRRDLEAKLEDLKKKTETRILSGLQQKGNFGQEYEGSVLKMPSGKLYKFISPRFKEQKFGSQGKK